MSKVLLLLQEKKVVILTHHQHEGDPTTIALLTGKHVTTVKRFLQSLHLNKLTKEYNLNQNLTQ